MEEPRPDKESGICTRLGREDNLVGSTSTNDSKEEGKLWLEELSNSDVKTGVLNLGVCECWVMLTRTPR